MGVRVGGGKRGREGGSRGGGHLRASESYTGIPSTGWRTVVVQQPGGGEVREREGRGRGRGGQREVRGGGAEGGEGERWGGGREGERGKGRGEGGEGGGGER